MEIFTGKMVEDIKDRIIIPALKMDYQEAIRNLPGLVDELHTNIPEQKRISYGLFYVVKELSVYLHNRFTDAKAPVFEITADLYDLSDNLKTKSVAIGIISIYGLNEHRNTLPYFEKAAASADWVLREMAQAFFRKLIKRYPGETKEFLLKLVVSEDPNLRRFVAETLRPAQENRWFYKNTEYPLSILRYLFKESAPYPRTAVGNNLSDLSRQNPELIFELVAELAGNGDKNSYWIAYRACRNLVKKEPLRVMDLLKVNEYKYKDRDFRRTGHDEIY